MNDNKTIDKKTTVRNVKKYIHTAESRGISEHGWLTSRHTFSFEEYYDEKRLGFGALKMLNDDIILPGTGYDMHKHKDVEIITIPIYGALEHKDSVGHKTILRPNEVQAISAGSGIYHSEYNASESDAANYLELRIHPSVLGVKPQYHQINYQHRHPTNYFELVASPDRSRRSLVINQNAYISIGNFTKGYETNLYQHSPLHGSYVFVISGRIIVDGEFLDIRDGMGFYNIDKVTFKVMAASKILLIEVPMTL